ncbi:MAG TPA: hypothetical protein VNR62_06725, partial [Cellulomonas sp.]|nr:hypothetical protein [Cellulomonas sp.]
ADWSRIVGEHVKALQDSGELADGSWLQSLIMGGMVDGGMDDYGSDDYGSDESDAFDLGGYRFDDSGNLLDPNGVVVEDWTFGDDGSLVDGDGNVLWAAPSADY